MKDKIEPVITINGINYITIRGVCSRCVFFDKFKKCIEGTIDCRKIMKEIHGECWYFHIFQKANN